VRSPVPADFGSVVSSPSLLPDAAAPFRRDQQAIVLMLAAGLCFTLMSVIARKLAGAGIHPFEVAFFRVSFGFLVVVPWIVARGGVVLRTRHIGLHATRVAFGTATMLGWFWALTVAPLAQITALSFTVPVIATALSALVLGETVRLRRWTAIAVGFVGTLIILRPGVADIGPGPLVVLAAAFVNAGMVLLLKHVGRFESCVTMTAWFSILMAPLILIPATFFWTWPSLPQLGWLALMGIVGNMGQILYVLALKRGHTSVVMPFEFAQLLWAAMLAWLFFAEAPSMYTAIGGTVICGAGIYIAFRGRAAAARECGDTPKGHSNETA
jgi:drug/metabolite transporter (DMT)-like permease